MPSSYTTSLRLTLPATGELSGTWGTTVNTGITELTDAAIAGYVSIAMTDADYTLTVANGATDQARRMMLNMTGTLSAARNVICPTASKLYVIKNSTTGGFAITLKTSAGTGISIPNGKAMLLMCDGTDVVDAVTNFSSLTLGSPLLPASGGTGITSLGSGVATWLGTPSSANLAAAVTDETGSGALVFGTSPTLSNPTITGTGTAAFGNLSYTGNLAATSTAQRITGDFSNATVANRLLFQTSTTNSTTNIGAIPSGTGTTAQFNAFNNSDPTNASQVTLGVTSSEARITSTIAGTGTFLPLTFYTNASERMRIDTSGNVGIGTATPGAKLEARGAATSGAAVDVALFAGGVTGTAGSGAKIYLSDGGVARSAYISGFNADGSTNAHALAFGVSSAFAAPTERMRLDSSGNLGLGVTPSAWSATFKALQISNTIVANNGAADSFFGANYYFDGTNNRYLSSAHAATYGQVDGAHQWYTAPSGTAGNAITFTQAMTLDASGNLGVGTTPSVVARLAIDSGANGPMAVFNSANANGGYIELRSSGTVYGDIGTAAQTVSGSASDFGINARGSRNLIFGTVNTERARITSGGDFGVGTASPGARLHAKNNSSGTITVGAILENSVLNSVGTGTELRFYPNDGTSARYASIRSVQDVSGNYADLRFFTSQSDTPAERARIDSSGNLLVGTSSATTHYFKKSNATAYVLASENSANNAGDGNIYSVLGSNCNATTAVHFAGNTGGAIKINIYGNGNIQNTNNSYGALSDLKLKENITDATPKLDDLMQVRVVNYNLKSDPDHKQLGVIAQELEQVFPGMIEETPDRDADGGLTGETTKSVKYSVFVPVLIKALQEQQALINDLRARVAALEAN